MANVAPLQGDFSGGEVSPLFYGRPDAPRYKASLADCLNFMPQLQGGMPRRPGTYFIDPVKDSTKKTRLIPFQYSTTQAYQLEFGDKYIRFYANYGQVQNASNTGPLEVATPYSYADIFQIKYTQSADVLYLAHPGYAPMKLMRYSPTNWQLVTISFLDGPYQPINILNTVIAASGTSGSVTVSAGLIAGTGYSETITGCADNGSGLIRVNCPNHGLVSGQNVFISNVVGTTEVNAAWGFGINVIDTNTFDVNQSAFVHAYVSGGTVSPAPFMGAQVGQQLRMEIGSTWGWLIITSVNINGYQVDATVQGVALGGTTFTQSWRLGLWTFGNYPAAVCFHEDRLIFGGAPSSPQRIDGSYSSNYENFGETLPDGTVTDANAYSFSLNASEVDYIQWMSGDQKGLLVGANSAEWILRPSVNGEAITPTNVSAKRNTAWGSTQTQSILVGLSTMHVRRGGRKLGELLYNFYDDGYRDTDLTELSEHITGTGVIDMAYTAIPSSPVVWLLRNDGALIGMVYDRDLTQLRSGWHRHTLGGFSDAAGTPAVVESLAVIPSPDGSQDDLWMVVQRWINGSVVRTIEYLTKIFEDIDLQQDAFFVDCGLTYDNPLVPTAITTGSSAVSVTVASHGLTTGNSVLFDGITGVMTAIGGPSALNGLSFVITVVDSNNFTLNGLIGTSLTPFVIPTNPIGKGPQVRKLVTTISGLTYLQGETVTIYADGVVQPTQVVNGSGQITLATPSAVVSIGYGYNSDGQLLRLEAGARNGTSFGKTRRIHRMGLMVHRGQGLQIGNSFSNLDPVQFRALGSTIPSTQLFSGIQSDTVSFDYDYDNELCFRISDPVPCTILAVMPMLETQDRA